MIASTMLTIKKKKTAIKKTQIHATDTGSPDVQVSILSKQIEELTKHLKKHPKDNHSRRGLLKMVSDRLSMLKFMSKKDPKRHRSLVKKLQLR